MNYVIWYLFIGVVVSVSEDLYFRSKDEWLVGQIMHEEEISWSTMLFLDFLLWPIALFSWSIAIAIVLWNSE